MNIFDPEILFDENKPFYPLVLSYVAQLHGLIELASKGFKASLEEIKGRKFGEHDPRVTLVPTGRDSLTRG